MTSRSPPNQSSSWQTKKHPRTTTELEDQESLTAHPEQLVDEELPEQPEQLEDDESLTAQPGSSWQTKKHSQNNHKSWKTKSRSPRTLSSWSTRSPPGTTRTTRRQSRSPPNQSSSWQTKKPHRQTVTKSRSPRTLSSGSTRSPQNNHKSWKTKSRSPPNQHHKKTESRSPPTRAGAGREGPLSAELEQPEDEEALSNQGKLATRGGR
jgi:hypothetical protein